MMMSPAPSATCCDSCEMISGTLQISSERSPFCRSTPLTDSQIRPLRRMADLGRLAQRAAGRGLVEGLADLPGLLLLARGDLQVAPGEIDADAVAEHVVERTLGRNVRDRRSAGPPPVRPRGAGPWSAAGRRWSRRRAPPCRRAWRRRTAAARSSLPISRTCSR